MQLRTLTSRANTVNGRTYASDPTIFAWELCNECHTADNYEIDRGLPPGQLLYNWQVRAGRFGMKFGDQRHYGTRCASHTMK